MSTGLPFRAIAPLRSAVHARPIMVQSSRWSSSGASSSKFAKPAESVQPASSPSAASSVQTKNKGKAPAAAAADAYVVPPLSRPLGVPLQPSSATKTWLQKKDEMLDSERHKAKRRALVKEATQGYFHDYNLARKANGGKLWIAPPVLIREDRALYFPDISGKSLAGGTVHTTDLFKGKISLVTILNTRLSEEHALSFIEPVLDDWEGQPSFSFVQINHQPNVLKSMLLSFFVSSIKRTIPEDRWGTYLISSGEWNELDITAPLGIENKLLGYVFLVDDNAKVRWAGCGTATVKETEDLRRAAAVLMRRMETQTSDLAVTDD